jgi:PAS domain-containing protein
MPANDPLQDEMNEISLLEAKVAALKADLRQKRHIILAQHTKLEAFFDSSIDAVVQMDFDGYITGWNHQAEKIFGWSHEQPGGNLCITS